MTLECAADFARWENSADPVLTSAARGLVNAAHLALGGAPGTKPLN